jgi:hypothetical protein
MVLTGPQVSSSLTTAAVNGEVESIKLQHS